MLHLIICFAVSVWLASSLFMFIFWVNAIVTFYRQEGKILTMPIGYFLYIHFCPIAHTIQCFKILQRVAQLQEEKRRV